MSDRNFWLSEAQFAQLRPLLPNKVRGVPRVDDRRVISGIVHVLRNGLMWRDAPSEYGPHKTLYNRFVRWSVAGVFNRIFEALAAESRETGMVTIDATPFEGAPDRSQSAKKGLFRAVPDAPEAASTPNCTRSATVPASRWSCC